MVLYITVVGAMRQGWYTNNMVTISNGHDRIDRRPCPRASCEHMAELHVSDGHCVVCASKKEIGEKRELPCALGVRQGQFRISAPR